MLLAIGITLIAFWMCGFDEVAEIFGFAFAKRNQTFADGVFWIFSFELLIPFAWSGERSREISFEPRWMFRSCAAELTLRMTTVLNFGFLRPQYFGFAASVTCVVVL